MILECSLRIQCSFFICSHDCEIVGFFDIEDARNFVEIEMSFVQLEGVESKCLPLCSAVLEEGERRGVEI